MYNHDDFSLGQSRYVIVIHCMSTISRLMLVFDLLFSALPICAIRKNEQATDLWVTLLAKRRDILTPTLAKNIGLRGSRMRQFFYINKKSNTVLTNHIQFIHR